MFLNITFQSVFTFSEARFTKTPQADAAQGKWCSLVLHYYHCKHNEMVPWYDHTAWSHWAICFHYAFTHPLVMRWLQADKQGSKLQDASSCGDDYTSTAATTSIYSRKWGEICLNMCLQHRSTVLWVPYCLYSCLEPRLKAHYRNQFLVFAEPR